MSDDRPIEGTTCTGPTATWCPLCGDCICERHEDGEVEFDGHGNCPLHAHDTPHAITRKESEPERWAEHLPPKGTVMDEFGQVWHVAHMQMWSSGKRQYTVEPMQQNGSIRGEDSGR